jgi:hypothetical protein
VGETGTTAGIKFGVPDEKNGIQSKNFKGTKLM